jgi:broad specificity phosphatase PhoE
MASSGEQKLTTRILLIRHGATTSTADDRFAGSSDVELSDEGRRQIATLSERLAGVAIAAIYCSNLRRAVETQFADEYHRWSEDPFETIIPGGENGRAVLERARPAVERIVAGHPNKTVAVVSHKATNRLLISAWMGSDPRRYRDRLAQVLACLNIIDFRGDRGPQLILMNDISHYHQQV